MSAKSRRTPTPRRGIHDGGKSPSREKEIPLERTYLYDGERSDSDSADENNLRYYSINSMNNSEIPVTKTNVEESITIKRKVTFSPTRQTQNQTRSPSRPAQTVRRPPTTPDQRRYIKKPPTQNNTTFPITYVITAIIFIGALIYYGLSITESTQKYNNCHQLDNLKEKYQHQEEYMWKSLKIGIEGVLNKEPTSPSVFLFIHQNTLSTRKIIEDIVKATATCFDPNLKAVKLDVNDLTGEDVIIDYGVAVKKYKDALKEGGVLLIADLNKIPAEAARALHFICDTISPIVDRVVIFLTLTSSELGKPVEIAEKTLNNLWGGKLEPDVLDPLIARVTDQVLRLY